MLEVDQQIDRYRVEKVLGQGGMAVVYRVVHASLGSYHAVKVLTLSSKGITERLMQEGRVQATLRHPNVVAVTDVIEVDGKPGLVMEYIDGPSLDEWLRDHRPPLDEALRLFRSVVSAVSHAHKHEVIHRDLKPGNIMLMETAEGYVPKVADFGLAKAFLDDAGMHQTRSGVAMGTPAYMAPEQIRDSKTVDSRADLFSLGCILYELVTGRTAFDGPDVLSIFNAVASASFAPPDSLVPDLPEPVRNAIMGCLRVDRERRIQSCEELLEVLDGAPLREEPTASASSSPSSGSETWMGDGASLMSFDGTLSPTSDPQLAPQAPPPGKRSGAGLFAAGVGGLGLLGIGAVVLLGVGAVVALAMAYVTLTNRADQLAQGLFAGELSYGSLSLRPRSVRLHEVKLTTPGGAPVFEASRIVVQGVPWKVISRDLDVRAVEIVDPVLHLRRGADGWDLPPATVSVFKGDEKARARVRELSFGPGEIVFSDDSGELVAAFDSVELSRFLHSPKDRWTADMLRLDGLELKSDDTHLLVESFTVSAEGEAEADGAKLWIRTRTDGKLDVPPVVTAKIADWAGGRAKVEPGEWQGIALGFLAASPSVLHLKNSQLLVVDRANAVRGVSWEIDVDRASFGPLEGEVLPYTLGGRVGEGRISAEGDWRADGLVRGTISVRDLPIATLSPYMDRELAQHAVAVAGGSFEGRLAFGAKSTTFKGIFEGQGTGVAFSAEGQPSRRARRLLDPRDFDVHLDLEGDLSSRRFTPVNALFRATVNEAFAPAGGAAAWERPKPAADPAPAQVAPRVPAPAAPAAPTPPPDPPVVSPEPSQQPQPADGGSEAVPAPDDPSPPAEGDAPPGDVEAPPAEHEAPPAEDEAPPAEEEAPPTEEEAPPSEDEDDPSRGEKFSKDVRDALDKLRLPTIGGKRK